jgi:hypothetical protein
VPLFGSIPKINNNVVVITVINTNGIKTINHDINVNPDLHNKFNIIVNIIITKNFNIAVLNECCNVSIIICIVENPIYNIAGGHKLYIIYIN